MHWDLPTLLRDIQGFQAFQRPLAAYTSWRIGGPADALVQVQNVEALQGVLELATRHEIPLCILGGGSNLLIRDGGVRGIVLLMRGVFRTCQVESCTATSAPTAAYVRVGVGHSLSRLAMHVARQGWSGLEFAYGIPGTVGGAMVMNAGTRLGDLSGVLVSARILCDNGEVQELPASALGLRYRASSYPPGAVVLAATLRVHQGDPTALEALMRESYQYRQRTQPLTLPNAGSVFKNPPGLAAGRLIEALGLKGIRRGGAMISPVHANFIVNIAHAKAADVTALIAHIQERVEAVYGLKLEPEVHCVGEEA